MTLSAAFVVVPALHAVIMDDPLVREFTLRFLEHGFFKSAAERQPIGELEH